MSMDLFSSSLSNALQLEPAVSEALPLQHLLPLRSILRKPEDHSFGAFVQAPLVLRTLGADRAYKFATYELTPNSVFVVANDLTKYPFRTGSTIVQGVLQLTTDDQKVRALAFLGKIESVNSLPDSESELAPDVPAGFVLRIIQMSFEEREVLEKVIVSLSKSAAA